MNIISIIIFVSVVVFMFYITYQYIQIEKQIFQDIYEDYTRFQSGRMLIKYLTESSDMTYSICDINISKLMEINNYTWPNLLNNLKIKYPVYLKIEYINGTLIKEIGGTSEEFYEFKRICVAKNELVKIIIRI